MDGTIGFIALNNIGKSSEYYLPHALMLFGILTSFFFNEFNRKYSYIKYPLHSQYKFEKILVSIYFYLIYYLLLSNSGLLGVFLYLGPLLLSVFTTNNFDAQRLATSNILNIFFPFLLLIYYSTSQSNNFFFLIFIVFLYVFILFKFGKIFFSFSILIFCTKSYFIGPTVIGDSFHIAEHFLASTQIFKGLFSVFPNIGYLEEIPGFLLVKLLRFISNGYIEISIYTSRTILSIALSPFILWNIYKRDKTLSSLFLLALPVDRISLLIALLYSILIYNSYFYKKYKLFLFYLAILPFIFLGLSPSYSLIPILTLIGIFPFSRLKFNQILLVLSVWIIIIFLNFNTFIKFLITYYDFSKYFDIAFSTSMSNLPTRDLILWPIYLTAVCFITAGSIVKKLKSIESIVKLILISLVLYQFISYGYGRIDPGFSRLIPLGIPFLYISTLYSRNFRGVTKLLLLIIIIFYTNINLPKINHNFNFLNIKNSLIQLDENNSITVNNINKFTDGREVINYSMEPALSYFISNALIPPFTSPFVTLGSKSQNSVVDFIKRNKEAVIYLGHSFMTYDGVDIRLRAPIIFKFLAENYNYFSKDGNIYAVPNDANGLSTAYNLFFNSMDIGKSSLFYSNHAKDKFPYRSVIVDCSIFHPGRFKIWTENNFILGNLNCGENLIPNIFFRGATLKIEQIQY